MHVNLPCAIVEDLLPLYLDDLSSPETRACVEAHLAVCPVCAAKRDAMAAPEPERPEIREVDYLKKVRSRQRRRITAAVLFTILAGLLLLAGKLFFLGQPAQESNITVLSSEITEDQVLQLHLFAADSGIAYRNWSVETDRQGAVTIQARQVLASPLFSSGDAQIDVPLEGVVSVSLCGKLLWQDGMLISDQALALQSAAAPYIGDFPAVQRLAQLAEVPGGYLNSLDTAQPPYGWTLTYQTPVSQADAEALRYLLERKAPLLLALVENLETITWEIPLEDGSLLQETVTAQEAAARWTDSESLKTYAASPAGVQRLLDLLAA